MNRTSFDRFTAGAILAMVLVATSAEAQSASHPAQSAPDSAQSAADPARGAAAPQDDEQNLRVEAREFIFVEGSLSLVPTANTIATKLPLRLALTPSNIGIVTAALIDEQYGQVLGDALRNVSNVNVQEGFGVQDYFVIRGFDSLSSTLILTDGAPEPEATFYQMYNVELVEVLKGPGGFLYGSNPLAGTVNLVRKQPFANRGLGIGAAIGSFKTVEGYFDGNYGRPGDRAAFRLNALFRDTDGYRDNKGGRAAAVNPAVTWLIDEDHSLVANFEYASSDFAPDAGIPLVFAAFDPAGSPLFVPAPVDPKTDYNSPTDRSEQDIYRFQVDYEGRIAQHVTLRNKAYYRRLDWLSDGTLLVGVLPGVLPDGGAGVLRTQIQLDDSQEFFGNQLEGVFEFSTGSIHHNLLVGFEAARFSDEYLIDVGLLAPVDVLDPVDPGFPAFPIPGQSLPGDARSTVLAPYAIDQISFSERFQVLAGVRHDDIDFEDRATLRQRDDSGTSPMLGAVWLPHENVSLYANYSRSFAPPSPRAFGQIEPEKSRQAELGVKVRWLDGRAQGTAAVYELERDNIAIPDDNGFTQQIGNQRSRGFEVELAAEPGSGFRTVLSYAYNDAELTEFSERVTVFGPMGPIEVTLDRSGNSPAFAPRHLFDFWASRSFEDGIGLGIGARYVGDQYIAEDNAFTIPSAFVVSAALSYEWSRYRLALNVHNLSDTTYFVRGFGSQAVTPAAPIAAYLRLGYAF